MVYITGSNGFVGKAISEYLEEDGLRVNRLNRKMEPEFLEGQNSFNNTVVHCAWAGVLGKSRNDHNVQTSNIEICKALAQFAVEKNASQVIAFGSQAEYGICDQITTEKTPLKPITVYGKTKTLCHDIMNKILAPHKIPLIWLRLYDPYGPGDNPQWFMPYIIQSALLDISPKLTECTQIWDYIYIKDIVRLVKQLIKQPLDNSDVFNLSSGSPICLRNVVDLIFDTINPRNAYPNYGAVEFRKDQQYYVVGNPQKIIQTTQWKPSCELRIGIRETINYFSQKHLT